VNHCIRAWRYLFCLLVIFMASTALAGETSLRSYPLPGHGSIQFRVPLGWEDRLAQPPDRLPPAIKFSRKVGSSFSMLVTPMWPANENIKLSTSEELQQSVRESADRIASRSVEKNISIFELKGPVARGYYFSATDSEPGAGEYKILTQGQVRVSEVIVLFSIFTNEEQGSVINDALALINSARLNEEKYRIPFPIGKAAIVFPLRNFQVKEADTKRPYYWLADEKSKLNVSFNFEPATKCFSSESCRDHFVSILKKLYPNKVDWSMSNIDDAFISENMDGPLFLGISLKHHHMNAHYVKDGVWIDLHLSKGGYEEKDRQLFIDFIRSITIK
jgi:hypothetical protein